MTDILKNIEQSKQAFLAELNDAEQQLLVQHKEISEKKQSLELELETVEKELSEIRREKLSLEGKPAVAAVAKPAPAALTVNPNKAPESVAAEFCNLHGLEPKNLEDYVLVILFNLESFKHDYSISIEETETLLLEAGYQTNSQNFKGMLYTAYGKLKGNKLATQGRKEGRTVYYKATEKGLKYVKAQIAKNGGEPVAEDAVSKEWIDEALKTPGTLQEVVERIVAAHPLPNQDEIVAFSTSVANGLKKHAKASKEKKNDKTVYEKA